MAPRLVLACLLAASGCASYGFNYLDPALPRCAEALGSSRPVIVAPETFQLVSFNIKFGVDPEKAMRTLERNGLQNADVFLLQEMDLPGRLSLGRKSQADGVQTAHDGRRPGARARHRFRRRPKLPCLYGRAQHDLLERCIPGSRAGPPSRAQAIANWAFAPFTI